MLVVVEVPDDMSEEFLTRELSWMDEENDRVIEEDPEDRDGGLCLRTENYKLDLARIVGILDPITATGPYDITPLEK